MGKAGRSPAYIFGTWNAASSIGLRVKLGVRKLHQNHHEQGRLDPAGSSCPQQGLPDGVSQLSGRCMSALHVHPDELQRLADHVDVGGEQPLVETGLAPFGHYSIGSDPMLSQ
jgi:hypothetical protein